VKSPLYISMPSTHGTLFSAGTRLRLKKLLLPATLGMFKINCMCISVVFIKFYVCSGCHCRITVTNCCNSRPSESVGLNQTAVFSALLISPSKIFILTEPDSLALSTPATHAVHTLNQTFCGSHRHATNFGPHEEIPFGHTSASLSFLSQRHSVAQQLFISYGACLQTQSHRVCPLPTADCDTQGLFPFSKASTATLRSAQPAVQLSPGHLQGYTFSHIYLGGTLCRLSTYSHLDVYNSKHHVTLKRYQPNNNHNRNLKGNIL
jgi:hypothetical protein